MPVADPKQRVPLKQAVRRSQLRTALRHLDADEVSIAAKAETRNREVYLPPISAYRWWARRTEAVNGAILDAQAKDRPGRLTVVDPFSGGGTIPLAAVIRGHRVYAQDLNPWATQGLAAILGLPSPKVIAQSAALLAELAAPVLGAGYSTRFDDGTQATVSHTFRVATRICESCGVQQRLFPHAVVTLLVRKERDKPDAFLACEAGHLFRGRADEVATCPTCARAVNPQNNYTERRRVTCACCGTVEGLSEIAARGALGWEIVLVERSAPRRRQIGFPSESELAQAHDERWPTDLKLGEIPDGAETNVLLRHGFRRWEDLYPQRQRSVMETLLQLAEEATDDAAGLRALRLAIVGTAEMAGFVSRWDRWYLKSYESMAGHRFNLTTFTAEPNVWGTVFSGRGTVLRRLQTIEKAATWLQEKVGGQLRVDGVLESGGRRRKLSKLTDVCVVEGSSERLLLSGSTADIVLTDPPYHDDVQYGELSLPLRAWAEHSTHRLDGEAVVNLATGQNIEKDSYRDLLTRIFAECRRVLKDDGHLIFSYANREPEAWADLFEALQTAGFRAVGYSIVHSENETDYAKRNGRACTLDVILDLAIEAESRVEQWSPSMKADSDERDFLTIVGRAFLKVGALSAGWRTQLTSELRAAAWLQQPNAAQSG